MVFPSGAWTTGTVTLAHEVIMKSAALSVLAFGIYLAIAGVLLLVVPGPVCDWFGLRPPGDTMWVRVSGGLLLVLAFYCIQAARTGQESFFRWSVVTRPWTIVLVAALAAAGLENTCVLAFGLVDVAAAGWTAIALRAGKTRQPCQAA